MRGLRRSSFCTRGSPGWRGAILFEYSIPRTGRRIDVVLLVGGVVFAVEFKVGAATFDSASLDQVWDQALDLKNFHTASHDLPIVPILVATAAQHPTPPLLHCVLLTRAPQGMVIFIPPAGRCSERRKSEFRDVEVVCRLQMHPEHLAGSEEPGEPDRSVCTHGSLALDDLVDPTRRAPFFSDNQRSLRSRRVRPATATSGTVSYFCVSAFLHHRSLVMRPHAEDFHCPLATQDLVYEPVVNVDATREGAGEIAYEFLERRRGTEGILPQHLEQYLCSRLQTGATQLLRILCGLRREDEPPGLAHQSSDSRHSLTGVAIPLRIEARMPGIDSRYSVS